MPRYKWHCLAVCGYRVTAMIGHFGLYLEIRWADLPLVVMTIIADDATLADASTVAIATACAASNGVCAFDTRSENKFRCHNAASASLHVLAIVRTHSSGYSPLAVSPDNITQSAPSRTAFATSEISARVARGFFTIDSSIWVAQITGLPCWKNDNT